MKLDSRLEDIARNLEAFSSVCDDLVMTRGNRDAVL